MPRETMIRELLERGRVRMEAERLADLERQKALADEAAEQWDALVDAVTADLGEELAATVTPRLVKGQPPPSFRRDAQTVVFAMRPFGAGIIDFSYLRTDRWNLGHPSGSVAAISNGAPGYRVSQGYTGRHGNVDCTGHKFVADLSEAVALCDLQTQGYLEARGTNNYDQEEN